MGSLNTTADCTGDVMAITKVRFLAAARTNKNRIMIYGPRSDGTYIVEFETADGEASRSAAGWRGPVEKAPLRAGLKVLEEPNQQRERCQLCGCSMAPHVAVAARARFAYER